MPLGVGHVVSIARPIHPTYFPHPAYKIQSHAQQEDPEAVWLVDHAWTFVASQKPSRQLARHPSLLQRMAALVGMESNPTPEPAAVLRALWPHANMYRLSGAPGYPSDEAIWYVMDEFGTRIGHAGGGDDDGVEEGGPTLGMAPFYFQPEACMYSVLWALLDMDCGDEATRGRYAHGIQRCSGRKSV